MKHINFGLPCGVSFEESELDDEEAVAEAWKIFQAGSNMARGGFPMFHAKKDHLVVDISMVDFRISRGNLFLDKST